MTETSPRNYYRDYVTPEAWQELRRWLVASAQKADDHAYADHVELLTHVLAKMDELVVPVPRVVPAQQPRVEHGVNLGGVFISEAILGELLDYRDRAYSEMSGEDPVLLEVNVGEALAKYGLAFQQTRGGWRGTELLEAFMQSYEKASTARMTEDDDGHRKQ